MPAEGNPLVELLLARGVNGESPIKRRSPRKSTAARHTTTPKSVRSAKLAIKTPRTASKRARKSIVVPDAELADEDALPQSRVATTKKNKARSTSNSKTPKSRSRPHTEDVEINGNDGGGASVTSCCIRLDLNILPHPVLLPPFRFCTHWLVYALIVRLYADATSPLDPAGPSRRAVQRTAVGPGRKVPQSPSSRGERAARRGARGRDYDDHSDVPLIQKQATTAPAMTTTPPKSGRRTGTKDARPPPARKKRAAPKTKTDAKRTAVVADDADGGQETKRTSVSAIARTQTGGASAGTEATAGKEAPSNSRKPGTEEGRGLEELPRRGEDVPDVVLPPTKRVQVLQEKSAPRKRKERTKNVEGDDGAIRTTKNENENGPPTKKRRRADPQTITAVRYVVTAPLRRCCAARCGLLLGRPSSAGSTLPLCFSL